MKKVIITALMLVSPFAFAGTGQGSVSCNSGDNLVALYSWFHSQADSYSTLTVFVQGADGKFKQFDAENQKALKALSIKTDAGVSITVTPNLQKNTCTIQEK